MKIKNQMMHAFMIGTFCFAVPFFASAQDGPDGSSDRPGPGPGMMDDNGPQMDFDGPGRGPQGGPQGGFDRIPDLTDAQKESIKKIRLAAQKDMLPLRNQINEKMAHLQTLNTAEKADMKAIDKTIDEVYALKADMAKTQAKSRQEVRKLLTEEQRLVFDSHMPGDRFGGDMHRGGKGGQGGPQDGRGGRKMNKTKE